MIPRLLVKIDERREREREGVRKKERKKIEPGDLLKMRLFMEWGLAFPL